MKTLELKEKEYIGGGCHRCWGEEELSSSDWGCAFLGLAAGISAGPFGPLVGGLTALGCMLMDE